MKVLVCDSITKKYGKKKVLDNVSLTLDEGHIYGFIGLNGAGKTTLMRIIAGLVFPTTGSISLFDEKGSKGLNHARRKVGFLIDEPIGYDTISIWQNLHISQHIRGENDDNFIEEALKQVLLSKDDWRKPLRNCSTGQRQRYGIASALLNKPELLILDEPINGLDPSGVHEFRSMLLDLRSKTNTTMLISSHILSELYQLATDYVFIHNGCIIEVISHQELTNRCKQIVLLRTNRPDDTLALLSKKLPTDKFEMSTDGSIKISTLNIEAETISKWMFQQGIMVTRLERQGNSIEDYFLELTRRSN